MGSTIIGQDFPHDIIHRGESDMHRHNKRVDDAVRKQLKDVIGQHDIITRAKNKTVKVRLKNLNQFRFIHGRDRLDIVGRDQFDDLKEGEIISKPTPGGGKPVEAGDADGEEIFEAEYSIEELTDMMIEELDLPDLDDTKQNEIVSVVLEWNDRRKGVGITAAIDKKKTILANLMRKAKSKSKDRSKKIPFIKDDLRFKTWEEAEEKHSNAVIFLMMDRSGSMWREKIYAVKAFYFWVVQFLRRKYNNVEIKFIAHDYNAREMKEQDFFTIADSGGTRVSSAYGLCKEMIEHNYPVTMWNIYCFHASDGDSWDDEEQCMELVNDILDLGANLFAYAEINIDNWRGDGESKLLNRFRVLQEYRDGVLVSVISELGDILQSLKRFLMHSARRDMEKSNA